MANTVLTPTIVAREALRILENNCVMGRLVYRGYESEFKNNTNGYMRGTTINVRRPTDFTVRTGPTASIQDVVEGQLPLTVNSQIGVDFQFTSQELTQDINESGVVERAIRPAAIQLANQIDTDLAGLYNQVYNWVGTAGQNINSFADFAKGPERLDLGAVPQDSRAAVLSPTDHWAMAGSATALYLQQIAGQAYKQGEIGMIGGVSTNMSQNVQSLTRGTALTATVNSLFTTSYALTLNSNTMSIALEFAASRSIEAGAVFTLSGVYAVNPVTKDTQAHLQQFVVKAGAGGTGAVTITITPPIITSGAFQTVSAAPTAGSAVTFNGAASTVYPQNMVFHKNAFALVMVPMVSPPGAVDVSRQSYKGYSARVIPYYTGSNDISAWRLDMLYGVKCLDPRLATRLSGTA